MVNRLQRIRGKRRVQQTRSRSSQIDGKNFTTCSASTGHSDDRRAVNGEESNDELHGSGFNVVTSCRQRAASIAHATETARDEPKPNFENQTAVNETTPALRCTWHPVARQRQRGCVDNAINSTSLRERDGGDLHHRTKAGC